MMTSEEDTPSVGVRSDSDQAIRPAPASMSRNTDFGYRYDFQEDMQFSHIRENAVSHKTKQQELRNRYAQRE
jgi:hypothetical protein